MSAERYSLEALERYGLPEAALEATARGECPGLDLDWFTLDRDGCVGRFTTAGFAQVPLPVFRDRRALIEAQAFFGRLPRTSPATCIGARPPRLRAGDWLSTSEQGLFWYDWRWPHRSQPDPTLPYQLMTRPQIPLVPPGCPGGVAQYLETLRFTTIRFAETPEILISKYFQELNL
jgi:hypothetical protein